MSWFSNEPDAGVSDGGAVSGTNVDEGAARHDETVNADGVTKVEGDTRFPALNVVPDAVDERTVKKAGGEPKVKQGRAPNKRRSDRPTVPAAAVRSLLGVVDALRDGYLPVAKLVAESGSNDEMAVAAVLTEVKPRRRMQQFVQLVERFDSDAPEDRLIDMALAMQGDSGLARRLFALVEASRGEGVLGRPAGAGHEREDAKRVAAEWDAVSVDGLKALVY